MKKKLIAVLLTGIFTFTGIGANVSASEIVISDQMDENTDDINECFSSETDSESSQDSDAADISIDEEAGDDISSANEISIDNSEDVTVSTEDGTQSGLTDGTEAENTDIAQDSDKRSTEDTGIVIIDSDGNPIKDADDRIVYYKTLQDAIDVIPEYSESNPDATTIQLHKSIVLDKTTRIINKRINIQAAGNISITRNSDDNFKDCMINVVGKDGQLQFFADGSSDSSLTISGLTTSDKIEIIDVFDAAFALNSGVTLKDNDYTAGGSAINCHNGTIVLAGGNITGYFGGIDAIYSNTDVYVEGDININTSNGSGISLYQNEISGNAKLIIADTLTGKISFVHACEKDGLEVIKANNNISPEEFQSSLKNIRYKNASKYELSTTEDRLSASLKRTQTEDPVTPPTVDYTVKYKSNTQKWLSHTSAQADFTATTDCEWAYVVVNTRADKKYPISLNKLSKFTKVMANTAFTVNAENVPEGAATIIVITRLNSSDKNYKYAITNLSEDSRPEKPQEPILSPAPSIRPARTHNVTESTVTGLEEPLKFYPGLFYNFKVTGAGQNDQAPFVNGDERWIPAYWTLSSASADRHTSWQVGSPKGISDSRTYPIYIYFNKQVFNGKEWVNTDVVDYKKVTFKSRGYSTKEERNYTSGSSKTKPKLNMTSVILRTGQSTSAIKVTNTNSRFKVASWSSDDPSIARVSNTGKITAGRNSGQTCINVIMSNGTSKKIKVTVQGSIVKTKSISGIKKKVTLSRKKTLKLAPKLSPVTSQEKITYSSSNPKVASVSSNGVVKTKKRGTAKITIKSGNVKAVCKVTVK